jgi:radical SAM-linked protein
MPRLLFEKKGNAVWISHLDLMRLFQRAFKRAGLPLTHTQGFNPRPSVSIALPLSVGVESSCELLDFDLYGEKPSNDEILSRLNGALVEGVKVLAVYEEAAKIKHLSLLECVISLEYDGGIPYGAGDQIEALFAGEQVIVEKKSKNGVKEENIIPMIRRIAISDADANTLELHALICCQNPALNPMQLSAAVTKYLPEFTPDYVRCRRVEVFDSNETKFR